VTITSSKESQNTAGEYYGIKTARPDPALVWGLAVGEMPTLTKAGLLLPAPKPLAVWAL